MQGHNQMTSQFTNIHHLVDEFENEEIIDLPKMTDYMVGWLTTNFMVDDLQNYEPALDELRSISLKRICEINTGEELDTYTTFYSAFKAPSREAWTSLLSKACEILPKLSNTELFSIFTSFD
jgi:hypothetical protein